jgi:BexC/CtrB/KpsE family polysaccharide export inner-membrane protein
MLPTALAVVYFGFLASDVYVSRSQFVVRSPDKPSMTALGTLLQSTGFSATGDEVYASHDYVQSRDALRALNRRGEVKRAYGSGSIFVLDRYDPFGLSSTFEDLYDYYTGKVTVDYNATSSVTTLMVRAFTPGDAVKFNGELLQLAEDVVNRLNNRGRSDLVRLAGAEVRDAEADARNAAVALARFRNAYGVIDPEQQAKVQLELVSKLQDELIGARMQILQLQAIAPENPQIPILRTRVAGLTREVDVQMGRVAGGRASLSASAVRYQRLELERQFADRRLAAAMTSLQEAQSDARRQQAYVERIVQPNRPDDAEEPRRLRGIVATFLLGLLAWGILRLFVAGVKEHHG